MNDGTKIALTAGILGTLAGIGMQSMPDPVTQTVGQGWILGGVASTALMGGFAAVASKWNNFKEERALNLRLDNVEKKAPYAADPRVFDEFNGVAALGVERLGDASEARKEAFVARMATIGTSLVQHQATDEMRHAASALVMQTLGSVQWGLNVQHGVTQEALNSMPARTPFDLESVGVAVWGAADIKDAATGVPQLGSDPQASQDWKAQTGPSLG